MEGAGTARTSDSFFVGEWRKGFLGLLLGYDHR